MRHGRAEDAHVDGDRSRALTTDGRAAVRAVGAAFARERHPLAGVVASPFLRTVQTAEAFLEGLSSSLSFGTDPRLASGTRAETMLDLVQDNTLPLLLIGHMPDVASLVSLASSGSEGTRLVFEPGTVACIRFLGQPRVGNGALTWMRQHHQW